MSVLTLAVARLPAVALAGTPDAECRRIPAMASVFPCEQGQAADRTLLDRGFRAQVREAQSIAEAGEST